MLKMKKILFGLPVLALVLSTATITVYAHEGHDGDEKTRTVSTSDPQKTPQDRGAGALTAPDEKTQTRRAELEREINTNQDKFRKNGDDLLMRLRSDQKETRTAEQRQKACEIRKQGLQTKLDNLDKNAQKHQKRIDEVFSKVVAYQKDKNLTIDNFGALVAAATAAQTKSQASASALESLKPTVDCNKDTVASDVAAFKSAAAQARADLSTYKKAVKDLLTAAKAAKGQAS